MCGAKTYFIFETRNKCERVVIAIICLLSIRMQLGLKQIPRLGCSFIQNGGIRRTIPVVVCCFQKTSGICIVLYITKICFVVTNLLIITQLGSREFFIDYYLLGFQ